MDDKPLLTKDVLAYLPRNSIIAQGTTTDGPDGINMAGTGKELRWVAVTGMIGDWCIYCHWSDHDVDAVRRYGDKVHDESNIRKLVPCSRSALLMYRH